MLEKFDRNDHFVVTGTENTPKGVKRVGMFYCIVNGKTYETAGGIRNAIRPTYGTMEHFFRSH